MSEKLWWCWGQLSKDNRSQQEMTSQESGQLFSDVDVWLHWGQKVYLQYETPFPGPVAWGSAWADSQTTVSKPGGPWEQWRRRTPRKGWASWNFGILSTRVLLALQLGSYLIKKLMPYFVAPDSKCPPRVNMEKGESPTQSLPLCRSGIAILQVSCEDRRCQFMRFKCPSSANRTLQNWEGQDVNSRTPSSLICVCDCVQMCFTHTDIHKSRWLRGSEHQSQKKEPNTSTYLTVWEH